jgi:ribosome-associated protein
MDAIQITEDLALPPEELEFHFSRSSGRGGQNVNTRDTKVELVFDLLGSPSLEAGQRARLAERLAGRLDTEGRLHVVASDERTQGMNRELAVKRFRKLLGDALRPDPPPRRPTRPSRGAQERRLAAKRARGRLKRERSVVPED